MKFLLAAEEAAQFLAALLALYFLPHAFPVWLLCLLFFSPDIAMAGYIMGNRAGAWLYNLAHHKAVALAMIVAGYALRHPALYTLGVLFYAHSSFDRVLGYGLKHEGGFRFTHLGKIGKDIPAVDGPRKPVNRKLF